MRNRGNKDAAGTRKGRSGIDRISEILLIGEKTGLFSGARTRVVRGRMPEALVNKAKSRTGIESDTELLEVALAHLALADDYPDWILSRKGSVTPDLDLDF